MKKIGKVLLAFLLVIGIGFTGFTLGKNSSKDNPLISKDNQKHMAQMEAMKELIDENFLLFYAEDWGQKFTCNSLSLTTK